MNKLYCIRLRSILSWCTMLGFLFSIQTTFCQIPAQIKPDTSFQSGLLSKVYLFTNPEAKKLIEIKVDTLYNASILEKVEVSDLLKNFSFAGQVPFLMEVSGEIVIPENRPYLFKLRSSDGSALWIDGKKVVNNDGVHNSTESEAEFDLDAGPHSILIRHFKKDPEPNKELCLSWFEPSKNGFEIIPPEFFRILKSSVRQAMNQVQPLSVPNLKSIGNTSEVLHPSLSKSVLHKKNFNHKRGRKDFRSEGSIILSRRDSLGKENKMSKPDSKAKILLEGSRLVGPSGCLACHKENDKVLGPAFRLVAQKYKSNPATVKRLVEKVYNGGTGVWGDYAMAPQSHLKKDKIEKMVRWILSLK